MKRHEQLELLNLPYSKLTYQDGPLLEETPTKLDQSLGL